MHLVASIPGRPSALLGLIGLTYDLDIKDNADLGHYQSKVFVCVSVNTAKGSKNYFFFWRWNEIKSSVTTTNYQPRSEGDNVLGSVRPSVCPLPLSQLNRLTYDLHLLHGGRP